MDIPIECSGRHLELEKQWSWGEVKSLPRVGGRKKWGRGRGAERKILSHPHPLRHSLILAPILPVCRESKMATKHSKDHHQNRLHWRLGTKKDVFTAVRLGIPQNSLSETKVSFLKLNMSRKKRKINFFVKLERNGDVKKRQTNKQTNKRKN